MATALQVGSAEPREGAEAEAQTIPSGGLAACLAGVPFLPLCCWLNHRDILSSQGPSFPRQTGAAPSLSRSRACLTPAALGNCP